MESVREHYNSQKGRNLEERKHTPNFNIRCFNNAMKRVLIKNTAEVEIDVLDIGIGKGGDLKKYENLRINKLYGLEISNLSLIEAVKRSRYFSLDYICRFKLIDCFGKSFDLERKFDLISCQFAFHYCFRSMEEYKITVENISRHLAVRGKFLITTPDSEEVLRRFKTNDTFNTYYKIENFKNSSSLIFGRSYSFTLISSVESCEEYIVDCDQLISDLKKENIFLIESSNFADYIYDSDKKHTNKRLVRDFFALNSEEKDVISFYKFMVFQRR
ncbi:hypothetical protein NUSPORA_00065 [Nucleospora cyclopteri]